MGNQFSSPERRTARTAFRNLHELAMNICYSELEQTLQKGEGTIDKES